jgi:hypothetical protein
MTDGKGIQKLVHLIPPITDVEMVGTIVLELRENKTKIK